MSNSYEPSLDEMREELQVLGRAVRILFATHPEPARLRTAWQAAVDGLRPPAISANASDLEKRRYETHCAELRLATDLLSRIGTATRQV